MTTNELKAAFDAARAASIAAQSACIGAKDAWGAACIADKLAEFVAVGGVVGVTRVRLRKYGAKEPDMGRGPYFVVGASFNYRRADFDVAVIKKDGTPGITNRGVQLCRDHVFIVPEDQPEYAQ